MQTKEQRHQSYLRHREEILRKRAEYRLIHRDEINAKKLEEYRKHPYRMILVNIKRRCNNPLAKDYKWYGAKDIKCDITLKEIKQLMVRDNYWELKHPTIDRKDSTKDYTFDNCQFIEHRDNCLKATKLLRRPVIQYDLNMNKISEYESISQASKEAKHDMSSIWDCLQGNSKQNKGSIWKYKE